MDNELILPHGLDVTTMDFVDKLVFTTEDESYAQFRHQFVMNSSKIDPQPGYPCLPGSKMYRQHVEAVDFVVEHYSRVYSPREFLNFIQDIHRILTKDILEESGSLRIGNVWIGGREAPPSYMVQPLMMDLVTKILDSLSKMQNKEYRDITKYILHVHNQFQYIHPFVDGNGRTGRLLMLALTFLLDLDPFFVSADFKESYYNMIEGDIRARNRQGYFIEFIGV